MSVSSISQSNVLGDDVLQMIFQQLDGKDLVKCEVVCRQWRDVLLSGTPWRRLFHRKIKCSHLWRKEQKKLEKNQRTLPTEISVLRSTETSAETFFKWKIGGWDD
jgi:hypothetical protein